MREFMDITKALSDPNRVRVLMALQGRELCVCQLIAMLDLAPSTVSKHISILKNARLVEWRKEGLWMHYRLPDKPSPKIKGALEWIAASLADSLTVDDDCVKLKKILEMEIEEVCRCQNVKCCRVGKKKNEK